MPNSFIFPDFIHIVYFQRLTQSTGLEALLHLPDGEIYDIELVKTKNALGLRLAGGHNKPTGGGYIYVKAIETGSIADKSCVKENDILLKVSVIIFKSSNIKHDINMRKLADKSQFIKKQ